MTLFFSFVFAAVVVLLTLIRTRWTNFWLFSLVVGTACFSISLECLGAAQAISFPAVRGAVAVSILLGGALSFLLFRSWQDFLPSDTKAGGLWGADLLNRGIVGSLFTVLVAGVLLTILTATAYTALLSVPNNWDSMTYHLPRVDHWLQDHSLAFYPTYNERQNESGILAEEGILALRSFNHAYPISNLVQWLSFAGCIVMAGRIARQIGGSRAAQYLASVLVATIPMAILQATSTQTDLVVGFFSAASVYFLIQTRTSTAYSLIYGFVIAAALAYLAKGTAAIFLSGFIIVYGAGLIARCRTWKLWLHLILSGSLGAAILAGHELRLLHAHGSLVGPTSAVTSAEHPNWRSMTFNILRNFASNLNVLDDTQRLKIDSQIVMAGKKLEIDDTDGRYSFFSLPFHLNPPIIVLHEDAAPNQTHAVLILIVMCGLLILTLVNSSWRSRNLQIIRYGIASILSMIAFCTLLKWQPWITRLQVGEFVLAIPVIAIALSSLLGIAMPLLVVFVGWQAKEPTFYNLNRPLLSRPLTGQRSILDRTPVDVLLSRRSEMESDYVRVADLITARRPRRVGIIIGGDGWEFPLWYLLRQRLAPPEMPLITSEMNENAIDPRSDMVVVVDFGHPKLKGMQEIAGLTQVFLYQRPR